MHKRTWAKISNVFGLVANLVFLCLFMHYALISDEGSWEEKIFWFLAAFEVCCFLYFGNKVFIHWNDGEVRKNG
jgi:hypothetical protein